MNLDIFGWNRERQAAFADLSTSGLVPARVVGEHRSHFQVTTGSDELSAGMTGRLRNEAKQRSDLAGTGDFVALRLASGTGRSTIEAVLPRSSALVRKASGKRQPQLLAANVDVVFIVTAPDGDFNLPRIARYLDLVGESGASPVIVLNKADLADDISALMDQVGGIARGVPVHSITARKSRGACDLERYFESNQTVVLVGSSGVGKSTLTNELLGRAAQATQDIRIHDSRGRHTTTHRQLFLRPLGGTLIDAPGIRSVEMWETERKLEKFDDIALLASQCKFSNCGHGSEPACAVRAAIKRGDLKAERLASYITMSPATFGARRMR